MIGVIFAKLFVLECFCNPVKLLMQSFIVNNWISNKKVTDDCPQRKRHSDEYLKKMNELEWVVLPHSSYKPDPSISNLKI